MLLSTPFIAYAAVLVSPTDPAITSTTHFAGGRITQAYGEDLASVSVGPKPLQLGQPRHHVGQVGLKTGQGN